MSGQPVNTKADQVAFRKEYLKTLNQQIANDDKNYMANIVYKKTGIPQQPLDTRTVTEKLRDVYALKPEIRSKLLALMDGGEAEKVVSTTPDSEIEFLAQNVDNLVAQLKPRFKIGMYADIFKLELEKYIKNGAKAVNVSTEGLATKDDLAKLISDISGRTGANADDLIEKLSAMMELVPTDEQIQSISRIQESSSRIEALESVKRAMKLLPSKADLFKSRELLDRRIREGDEAGANREMARMSKLMENVADIERELENAKMLAGGAGAVGDAMMGSSAGGYIPEEDYITMDKQALRAYAQSIRSKDNTIFGPGNSVSVLGRASEDKILGLLKKYDEKIRGLFGVEPSDDDDEYSAKSEKSARSKAWEAASSVWDAKLSEFGYAASRPSAAPSERSNLGGPGAPSEVSSGSGMKRVKFGKGVTKPRGRPPTRNYEGSTRPPRSDILAPEDIDMTMGVKVQPRFAPFGKYVIHKNQLMNDIISLRTKKGSTVPKFKVQRVSKGMGVVLRKIVGGGNPTFDEVASLNDDERDYLSKLAATSNISDRFNIPAPSKKEDDKDIDQFEIMRGQMLAGNDSTELVKKFKVLIMKLSKKGLLPQREAKDLLYELVSLGY